MYCLLRRKMLILIWLIFIINVCILGLWQCFADLRHIAMNKKVVIFILVLVLVCTVVWAQNVWCCATRSCPQTKSEYRANCAEQPYSSDVNCWKQPCSYAKCPAVCKGNKSRSKNQTTSCSQQQCNRQCSPCPKSPAK